MKIAFVYNTSQDVVSRGAGYVASVISAKGYNLDFLNTCYIPIQLLAKKIIKTDYSILMVSSMTIDFHKISNLISIIRKKKKIPILLGGVHATLVREKIFEQEPLIDYLCVGEGENMIIEFLEGFKTSDFSKVSNLIYRQDNKLFINTIEKSTNLTNLPEFKWSFFSKNAILGNEKSINIFATRGCPYNCSYCCNTVYLGLYGKSYLRFRPIEQVIDELKILHKKYKPKKFFFGDEMILSDLNYAHRLFSLYKKEISLPYGAMARVEHIKVEIVSFLKESGCDYIGAGVECGDEEFRKKFLNRHMKNEQIINAYSILKANGIKTSSFNIIGYPVDYDDNLTQSTIELNKIIHPESVQVSIFYPFPGTKLYDYCISNDLIDQSRLLKANDYYGESILKNKFVKKNQQLMNSIFAKNKENDISFYNWFSKYEYKYKKATAILKFFLDY